MNHDTHDAAPVDYDGPDESVKCAYPPCTRRLRKSSFPGPQWCSKEHRSASEDGVTATVLTFRIEERRTATVKVDVAKHCAFYSTDRADFDGTDEEFVKHSLDRIGTYDLLHPAEEPDDGIDVLDIEDDAEIEPW